MPAYSFALDLVDPTFVPFIFVLSLVVFFHELGHFLVGRWCGVKVDAFSLGFGPEIAALHRSPRHALAARRPAARRLCASSTATPTAPARPISTPTPPCRRRARGHLRAQDVWKRAATVAAGPIANFILALVIFTGMFYLRGPRRSWRRASKPWSRAAAAAVAGFKKGDCRLAIDGAEGR